MSSRPVGLQQSIGFGEDYELDLRPRRLRRGSHVLKLERIPFELLLLFLEHQGEIVTRDQIVSRIWGDGVFLDTDNSIRGAIRKLRQALKDDADAPRFIETITGQGYRFIAPVTVAKDGSGTETPKQSSLANSGSERIVSQGDGSVEAQTLRADVDRGRKRQELPDAKRPDEEWSQIDRRWLVFGILASLAIVCVVVFLAVWRWQRSSGPPIPSVHKTVVAVLPFENLSGDPDQEFFSDGVTEEMIVQLGKLNRDRLTVIARSSVAKYKGSTLTANEIGKELKADYLVQGSVRRSSQRVRITVQLIQPRSQTDLWTESYDREMKDVLALQDSVVRSIAGQIHVALTEQGKARLASPRQAQAEAYVAYLKGRFYWNKRTGQSIQKAEKYFQQAIDSDPTYAAAYSGLADCNSGLAWHGFKAPSYALPRAYAAARKALELNPDSGEAHASLGLVMNHQWDWTGAETEFERALQLDPQYANAHHWYGDYLSMQRRHQEAITEATRALQLDPLNLMISTWVGLRYYLAHDYVRAIQQNRGAVDLDPNFAPAHLVLGEDYIQAGLHSEAVNELMRAADLSGDSPLYKAQVAVALASAGRSREARRIAHELETISKNRYVSAYGLAQIYAALNDNEATFKWLQAAYHDHAVWMGYLGVDPIFEAYHSDQRFRELLQRIDLH